ncbi:hypothetical protein K470DRAFT_118587 [Piedraia hortae CBS 480.64]|uniref:MADS-box domain-containing protein n=1 Tax=Piedraia hortae CBS 480.64 TaxID=1314780 RepID=A0A6A7BUG3_9PEZI|nr:hypothetical protein K470DRAFT_118587 [Piedraia hortae CBS 480.64]
MGRRKIEIKPIVDDRNRSVTFLKRKTGLFKKAHELSVLCSVDVAVVVFGNNNKKLYEYSSSDLNGILNRMQYCNAHEHKGPEDFIGRAAGDEDEDEAGDGNQNAQAAAAAGGVSARLQRPSFQQHQGRNSTPNASQPGAVPYGRGPSPLPPNSRPASRTSQHPAHTRKASANVMPMPQPPPLQHAHQPPHQQPQPAYAYTPNQPFYAAQYTQAYPQQMQPAYINNNAPAAFAAPPPPAAMQRSAEHLQARPQPSPRPQPTSQPPPPTSSAQPASYANQQPKPLPATHKQNSIFTPVDDSRSILAQHWTTRTETSSREGEAQASSEVVPKVEDSSPSPTKPVLRGQSPPRNANDAQLMRPPPDARRPRLTVQIPSEQSGDEGATGTGSAVDDASAGGTGGGGSAGAPPVPGPLHGVKLPPLGSSAGAPISAGARGPPNPFARPTIPTETPMSALPSRVMGDSLLPSPNPFLPDWFGRSTEGNTLPSPLNFQTPVGNGGGWKEEDRKRANEEEAERKEHKRAKTEN